MSRSLRCGWKGEGDMIKVILNGDEMTFYEEDYRDFGELYDSLAPKGMVLKKIVINDIDVPPEKIDELRKSYVEDGTQMCLEFVTPKQFLEDMLPNVLNYISKTTSLLDHVVEKLREGERAALKEVVALTESITALENLRLNVLKIETIESQGFEDAVKALQKLLQALESNRIEEISASVERDVPVALEYYREFFFKTLSQLRNSEEAHE